MNFEFINLFPWGFSTKIADQPMGIDVDLGLGGFWLGLGLTQPVRFWIDPARKKFWIGFGFGSNPIQGKSKSSETFDIHKVTILYL